MSEPTAPDDRKYFFLHLHKTAGTALWTRMHHVFGDQEFYPGPDDGSPPNTTLVVEDLLAVWNRRRDEIRVVTGHFPLCTTELLGGEFCTFTVLREPVDRTLSAIRNHRQRTGADDLTLEEIYDDPLRQLMIRNHMVKMLSLRTDEMTDGVLSSCDFTPARLERAKEALTTIDVVGIQSRFDQFCAALERRFGWSLGPETIANRSRPAAPDEVSDEFRARILEENAADVALYEFACTIAV